MREKLGHPDCPRRDGEDLLTYPDRLAKFQGYLPEGAPLRAAFRPKNTRRRFQDRLDELFPKRRPTREPGEDDVTLSDRKAG